MIMPLQTVKLGLMKITKNDDKIKMNFFFYISRYVAPKQQLSFTIRIHGYENKKQCNLWKTINLKWKMIAL